MPDLSNQQPYQPMGSAGQQFPGHQPVDSQQPQSTLSHGNPIIQPAEKDPAVEMIRRKIQNLYAEEPDARQEIAEVQAQTHPGSKHQQYMAHLQASGKSLAEIQSEWHNYYVSLPDNEKYEVWQEFYIQNTSSIAQQAAKPAAHSPQVQPQHQQAQPIQPQQPAAIPQPLQPIQAHQPIQPQAWWSLSGANGATGAANASAQPASNPNTPFVGEDSAAIAAQQAADLATHHKQQKHKEKAAHGRVTTRSRAVARAKKALEPKGEKAKEIKHRIVSTAKTASEGGRKLTRKHHIQSALFGLACGFVVLVIVMFGLFNQLIIAPFIQPSRAANDTPVIVDTASAVISGGPKILIPKINLEIPVDYTQTTIDTKAIELALDNGVVHYPTTVRPGETGNAAYFGHSSNNIFNPGKYKFAFVLLQELEAGDIFYLNKGDKTYAYKVFDKKIVKPQQVDVLNAIPGKTATATLITCDPPGTSINRLVVVGEQISPDPNTNGAPTTQTATTEGNDGADVSTTGSSLPGNGPGLLSRIFNSIF